MTTEILIRLKVLFRLRSKNVWVKLPKDNRDFATNAAKIVRSMGERRERKVIYALRPVLAWLPP